jgi:acetyl-CoA carboxylase carboxyltransferase component
VFTYLPSRAGAPIPFSHNDDPVDRAVDELLTIVPEQPNRAYDVKQVLEVVLDRDSFIEWAPLYARNIVTGLGRVNGRTVAVIANQPKFHAGVLDCAAVIKATRLMTLCRDLTIPLVSFVDVPGVLPTKEQEHRRLMSRLYDFGALRLQVTAPKVVVILRKAIGFALQAMSAGDPEALTFAWPHSQIAFTGVDAAVRVAYRRELEAAPDASEAMQRLGEQFRGRSAPWEAARLAYLDDVIHPAETRLKIARALEVG